MSIEDAVAAIRRGDVIGLPTDTVYGIAADPMSESAVARLFELKGRPDHKPIGLLVASLEQAREIGEMTSVAARLAAAHWPGALTLVVAPRVILADWVGDAQSQTVGLRVPDHPTTLQILAAAGPLAVTSANLSGGEESLSHDDAQTVFGELVPVYVEGRSPGGQSSTVVDVSGGEVVVLRQGPVHL